jgi:hypothetical protein
VSALDEFARKSGFEDYADLSRLILAVDLMDQRSRVFFETWKEFDGTKAGLLGAVESGDIKLEEAHYRRMVEEPPRPKEELDK